MTILALLGVLVAAPDQPADPVAAVAGQVKKVNATHYVVPRQAVDMLLREIPRLPIRISR